MWGDFGGIVFKQNQELLCISVADPEESFGQGVAGLEELTDLTNILGLVFDFFDEQVLAALAKVVVVVEHQEKDNLEIGVSFLHFYLIVNEGFYPAYGFLGVVNALIEFFLFVVQVLQVADRYATLNIRFGVEWVLGLRTDVILYNQLEQFFRLIKMRVVVKQNPHVVGSDHQQLQVQGLRVEQVPNERLR